MTYWLAHLTQVLDSLQENLNFGQLCTDLTVISLYSLRWSRFNLRSGVPIFFRDGKVRLIQLLDYLSVASPESGLFSDWSRNKRYLELSH